MKNNEKIVKKIEIIVAIKSNLKNFFKLCLFPIVLLLRISNVIKLELKKINVENESPKKIEDFNNQPKIMLMQMEIRKQFNPNIEGFLVSIINNTVKPIKQVKEIIKIGSKLMLLKIQAESVHTPVKKIIKL